MNRQDRWWTLLVVYTALIWAAALGGCALIAALPDSWNYPTDRPPPLAILQSAMWTLVPALAPAALALLVGVVVLGLLRGRRALAAPVDDAEAWPDDGVLVDRVH